MNMLELRLAERARRDRQGGAVLAIDYTTYTDEMLRSELQRADDAARYGYDKAVQEYEPMTSGYDEYMQQSGLHSTKAGAIRGELNRRGIYI
jgi:hypothetical protein